jgi:hypothetical protein
MANFGHLKVWVNQREFRGVPGRFRHFGFQVVRRVEIVPSLDLERGLQVPTQLWVYQDLNRTHSGRSDLFYAFFVVRLLRWGQVRSLFR